MTARTFDAANKNDFDRNTEALNQGILRIASDKSLKPNSAELSRITGIHRNTIRQRVWPLERLEAIKDSRRLEVLAARVKVEKKKDPKNILMERLEKSRLEVLYWFDKYQDSQDSFYTVDKRLNSIRESRDFYVKMYGEEQKKVKDLESEILKLRDALNFVSSRVEDSK